MVFSFDEFAVGQGHGDAVEWAHCSKITGRESFIPWRNLTEMSTARRMARQLLSAQLPERVLSSSHWTSRVP
jgi:hypothetical protein